MSQLSLPLKLQDHAVFDTFWPIGNEPLLAFLSDLCDRRAGPGCWLWGKSAVGKSHLLQAVCERIGDQSVFLPMQMLRSAGPGVLDGMAERQFVCLDDIGLVAGDPDWERALFGLFESVMQRRSLLLVAAQAPPRETGFALPDLASRFSLLPAFAIRALAEEQKQAALKHRAKYRGLELPDKTARFLTTHSRRDMASLYGLLDRLASEAVRERRRLTIPFVKNVMRVDAP